MSYPHRPTRNKQPKSSEHISGRRKFWSSDGSFIEINTGTAEKPKISRREVRSNQPWFRSPSRNAQRAAKTLSLIHVLSEEDWKKREGLWPDADYASYVARKQRQIENMA